ncbi:BESS motif [Nesidiocoris tenuis]|uniref:BESS motif n=1 Tax=Nesidiocoris tenuis TaxID=355587 RepID=A0ABN7AK75_9HEMI|nr:BESS motif [Nesidiocoris tenuis]
MPLTEDRDFMVMFVECIKKHPCIWDTSLSTYARIDLTAQAWQMVAEEMNDSEENCRTRWKNIRTSFGRSLRPHKTGKLRKPYYMAKYLTYLLPFVKGGLAHESSPTNDGFENPVEFLYEGSPTEILEVNGSNDENSSIDESLFDSGSEPAKRPRLRSRTRSGKRKNYAEVDDIEIDDVKPKFEAQEPKNDEVEAKKDDKEDSDWLFFRSLLTDFKKLDNRRKRNVKCEILSLLNEHLNEMEGNNSKDADEKCNIICI